LVEIRLARSASNSIFARKCHGSSTRAEETLAQVFACVFMSASMVGLGFASRASAIVFFGLVGGFGNGCYQAVDLALAVDTLPDAAEAARYLGVWGVGAFVGVCLGPLFGAPLLYAFGQVGAPEPPANGQLGYLALFTYGSLAIFASALVLVKKVRLGVS